MTYGSTPREPSASTIRSPETCRCSSRRSTFPAMRGKPCTPSLRSRGPHPKIRWRSLPAGRHRLRRKPQPATLPSRICAPTRGPEHLTQERQNMTEQNDAKTGQKVWFITGAGRGLGIDIAKAALAAGHAVVATGSNPDKITRAVGGNEDLLAVKLDVT